MTIPICADEAVGINEGADEDNFLRAGWKGLQLEKPRADPLGGMPVYGSRKVVEGPEAQSDDIPCLPL